MTVDGAVGRVDAPGGVMCAWAALLSKPVPALAGNLSSTLCAAPWPSQAAGGGSSDPVETDSVLAAVMRQVRADGITALGCSVRIPGLFGPTGAAICAGGADWETVERPVGPLAVLSGLGEGWIMWHEPGAWAAVLRGTPSQGAQIAEAPGAGGEGDAAYPLPALAGACRAIGIGAMLAVSDGTGTPPGYGGVAVCTASGIHVVTLG